MGARARAIALGLVAALTAACATNPGASPELTSAFAFAAYPRARLIETQVYPDTLGYIQVPGRNGTRLYESTDTREQVAAYYRQLAADKQWSYTSSLDDRNAVDLVTLRRERFDIRIGDDDMSGYPAPSPTPIEGSSPTPAPSPSAWRLRVSVIVSD